MIRVGIGYDIHRLVPGLPLTLGGVLIPHTHGLDGHSDADVLCHAIADAVLGALGLPDIGHHFPNSDPACRGMSSLNILARCRELADAAGATLHNIDATLLAEEPRIQPHLTEMKARVSGALRVPAGAVGIKATTNERLGSIGRREGMAAMAVACLDLPTQQPSPA